MFFGTPYITATALAGTPLAMKAMPGPLPMPMSALSAVKRLLQLGVAGRGRSLDLQPVLGEDAGLRCRRRAA